MRFPCHPVDASFFDTAPMRFKNVAELSARPADVIAIFEDGESWPRSTSWRRFRRAGRSSLTVRRSSPA